MHFDCGRPIVVAGMLRQVAGVDFLQFDVIFKVLQVAGFFYADMIKSIL
jgi:hypothetical protein